MNDVLHDFSYASLTAANKGNLFAYYDNLGRSTARVVDYRDDDEFEWLLTGISASFMNNVLRTQLPESGVDERIKETLAYMAAGQVQYLCWWVEADSAPAQLGEHLEAQGLVYYGEGPAMAVDLHQLDATSASVPGLIIEPVTNDGALRQWADTVLTGFDISLDESEAFYEIYQSLGYDLPLRHYLGYWNGRPAATSQLFLSQGVAGLYCVTTIEAARRQGIGAAMSAAAMLEARELGYRIGILQATSMGKPVYQRMGFQEHAQFGSYFLFPQS